jgi:hypothetical protein
MNCWKTLRINETNDKDVIQRAYRELVKQYHPDKASTPERVRINTVKCAEINAAYNEALNVSEKITSAPESVLNENPKARDEGPIVATIQVIVGISIVGGMLYLIPKGIGTLGELAESNWIAKIIKAILMIPVGLFGIALIGLIISGAGFFIAVFILDFLLVRVVPKKYFDKLIWITTTIFSSAIVLGYGMDTSLGELAPLKLPILLLVANFWSVAFFLHWLYTWFKYRSLKSKGFLTQLS